MLAGREPVTLRALVAGTGASTMAVYTHFGGMPGVYKAVRQEGFTRLAAQLHAVDSTTDPVRDLMALGAGYVSNALAHPALYGAMFDTTTELEDPQAAAATFQVLVAGAERARHSGRFSDTCDPQALGTQFWAVGHGLSMLVLSGILPRAALDLHAPALATAVFISAGDQQDLCRRSVQAGWSTFARRPLGQESP